MWDSKTENRFQIKILSASIKKVKSLKHITMSAITDRIKGNWNVVKGKLKQEYGELTDNDLTYVEGKEDELIGRIQKKVGKSKQEVMDFINKS